jgi:hypothetical protein
MLEIFHSIPLSAKRCGNLWLIVRFAFFLSAAAIVYAQSAIKTKPADYPVHIQLDRVTLAAEYLVRSLPTERGTLSTNDFLVVEVAFFGPAMSRLKISPDQFTLKMNGRGSDMPSQLPSLVAESIKFPDNSGRPSLTGTAGVGVGDGTVTVGPRPPQSRFPGDGNDRTTQPVTLKQTEEEGTVEYRVQNASLPEGEKTLPRSGLIYFYYRGKTKNIHSLELFYDGPMGKASLKILP